MSDAMDTNSYERVTGDITSWVPFLAVALAIPVATGDASVDMPAHTSEGGTNVMASTADQTGSAVIVDELPEASLRENLAWSLANVAKHMVSTTPSLTDYDMDLLFANRWDLYDSD